MSLTIDPRLFALAPVSISQGRTPVSPILELPAAQQLLGLGADARRLLATILRQLGAQAGAKFATSLRKNKVFMASYWSDVSFHARFCARSLDRRGWAGAVSFTKQRTDPAMARSSQAVVRNPVLALPAAQQVFDLPPASRRLLGSSLRNLAREARDMMVLAIKRRRLKWASYWHAMSVYAKHIARVIDPRI
jgi:hypothetical protein